MHIFRTKVNYFCGIWKKNFLAYLNTAHQEQQHFSEIKSILQYTLLYTFNISYFSTLSLFLILTLLALFAKMFCETLMFVTSTF